MAKLGITIYDNTTFLGFDNAETGIEDSNIRPLAVGDVVKVLQRGSGAHEIQDPKYPDFDTYDLALITHNYSALYGPAEADLIMGWSPVLNSDHGLRPVETNAVLFDHHLGEGELSIDSNHTTIVDVDKIEGYKESIANQ
jgi:hypothetical protein